MAYTKTNWVNDQQPDIDADNLNKMEQGIADAQFPDGGTEGQLLARTANGQGWVDPPNSAVWGGITGDIEDQTDLQAALSSVGKVDSVNGIQPDVYKNVQVDVEITKDGWDALPSTKYTDDINYYIKDGTNVPQVGVISASGVQYDNTQSGMSANTVQGAVDENASAISSLSAGLTATELTASEYVTINSSFTVNSLTVMRLAPHIAMIRYDIAGTIAEGQTVVGAGTTKVKNLSYGAGRVSATSGTYPATCVIFGGAFRIHATKAGTAAAGTVIIEI